PWDREQTHASIRKNFIEETYEAVEAIDKDDAVLLREELGDVLLQVVFHAQMEKERGSFDFSDVCDGICKKLIVRHPHIFSEESLSSADAVHDRWEEIKKETKGQKTAAEILAAVPKQLPALMRAIKVQQRAERALSGAESLPWTWEQVRKTEEALSHSRKKAGKTAPKTSVLCSFSLFPRQDSRDWIPKNVFRLRRRSLFAG
ncbi:MAG: MazG family protein, partial [Clostridia bacterium]|nr:MazG family protein [Clostridia bacterium]